MSHQTPIQPTCRGFVPSSIEALLLFEACLQGKLEHVRRRPHDRERAQVIRSGNIFIFEESASGIKRWTDGATWSPSRISGNFLIYREMDRPFLPGEKKKAIRRGKSSGGGFRRDTQGANVEAAVASLQRPSRSDQSAIDRALVGSLVDSYQFKLNGLIKKTMSIMFGGVQHHLISYYTMDDVKSGKLEFVSSHTALQGIVPRQGLVQLQNFRAAFEQEDWPWHTPRPQLFVYTQHQIPLHPGQAAHHHPHHQHPAHAGPGAPSYPGAMMGYSSTPQIVPGYPMNGAFAAPPSMTPLPQSSGHARNGAGVAPLVNSSMGMGSYIRGSGAPEPRGMMFGMPATTATTSDSLYTITAPTTLTDQMHSVTTSAAVAPAGGLYGNGSASSSTTDMYGRAPSALSNSLYSPSGATAQSAPRGSTSLAYPSNQAYMNTQQHRASVASASTSSYTPSSGAVVDVAENQASEYDWSTNSQLFPHSAQ